MEKGWQMKSSARARRIPIEPPRGERGKRAERRGCERRGSSRSCHFLTFTDVFARARSCPSVRLDWRLDLPLAVCGISMSAIICRWCMGIWLDVVAHCKYLCSLPPSHPPLYAHAQLRIWLRGASSSPISPHTCSRAPHKGFVPLFSLSYRQMGSVLSLP